MSKEKAKKLIPVADNLLVRKLGERESHERGKVYDADQTEKLCRGIIVEPPQYVGLTETGSQILSALEVGDTIIFDELRGVPSPTDPELLIIKYGWILAKEA